MISHPVGFDPGLLAQPAEEESDLLGWLQAQARDCGSDLERMLRLAPRLAAALPLPGQGRTALLWEALARLAAVDLTLARVVEPHLDAVAILAQVHREHDRAGGGTTELGASLLRRLNNR